VAESSQQRSRMLDGADENEGKTMGGAAEMATIPVKVKLEIEKVERRRTVSVG